MTAAARPRTGVETLYLRLAPGDIAFVKFLFEAYEEVATVRTVDKDAAVIVLLIAPDFLSVARAILDDIRRTVRYEEIAAPALPSDDWLMRELDEDGSGQ
ncbi:DUF4911 domain-containing protein [Candidatus Binatia bacterium]|nr:DUF4911 domain-containing protein [Candidatus Binatia bacterium]